MGFVHKLYYSLWLLLSTIFEVQLYCRHLSRKKNKLLSLFGSSLLELIISGTLRLYKSTFPLLSLLNPVSSLFYYLKTPSTILITQNDQSYQHVDITRTIGVPQSIESYQENQSKLPKD